MPFRLHLRMRCIDWDGPVTWRIIRGHDVGIWSIDVDPDEVEWRRDRFQLFVGKLRRILAGLFQVVVSVPALKQHGSEVGIQVTSLSLGRLNTLRSLYGWNHRAHVFGKAHLRARLAPRADCLHGESVTQHRVMTHLVELAVR